MKKQFLITILLAILMSMPMFAYDFEKYGIYYEIGSNNTVSVVQGSMNLSGHITIPSIVDYGGKNYSVTCIRCDAFENCYRMTSIFIPSSISSIENYAFEYCDGLSAVYITDLEAWCKISFGDFRANPLEKAHHLYLDGTEVNNLIIPNSVSSIGARTFYGCSDLTSITIPNSVTNIGSYAFNDTEWYNNQPNGLVYAGNFAYRYKGTMPNNTSITIKDGTVGIAGSAFRDCSGLTSITIPNSVTSIGNNAFSGCSGLTSIIVESGNTMYDSRDNCNAIIEKTSNTLIAGCKNSTIPNSVTSIGSEAFNGCSNLTSITIPSSVTSIGNYAFYGCSGLTSIISFKKTPPTSQNYAFTDKVKANCVLWVPIGSANAYKEANVWKNFQKIRELILGDVNVDLEVNEADLGATTNHIMGIDQDGFYENLADLNSDEAVNAADVVKLVTILNIQEGLSIDWQMNYSNQVVSSLTCTLSNDGDDSVQVTKCELYCNNKLASSSNFKVTLAPGKSKKCSFDDLASLSAKTGFSVVWYYTYNGESYKYLYDLTE